MHKLLVCSLFVASLGYAQTGHTIGATTMEGPINGCGVDSGTGNAYVVTGCPVTELHPQVKYSFQISHTNTGAVTLQVGSLAAVPVKKYVNGSLLDLVAGDWTTGSPMPVITVTFDGVNMEWTSSSSTSGGSQRVVYMSQISGIGYGDAVVAPGSNTTGTDMSAIINAAVAGGNVHLIIDGQYGINNFITLYSNTTISCLAGDGLIDQDGYVNGDIFVNAHENAPTTSAGGVAPGGTYSAGFLVSNVVDTHIKIEGCILNSNYANRSGGSASGEILHFAAVSDLTITGNELYDPAQYFILTTNGTNLHYSKNWLHTPRVPDWPSNHTDGYHFVGPVNNVWISDSRLTTGDDAIALNANDGFEGTSSYEQWGPITDVWVNNINLENCYSGVRLLSSSALIDRVHIRNVSGTIVNQSLEVEKFFSYTGDNGNYGEIDIDGWNVSKIAPINFTPAGNMRVNGVVQSLSISNVKVQSPTVQTWPELETDGFTVTTLNLADWSVYNPTGNNSMSPIISTNAAVTNFNASHMSWVDSSSGTGYFFGGSTIPTFSNIVGYEGPMQREMNTSYIAQFVPEGARFKITATTTGGVLIPATTNLPNAYGSALGTVSFGYINPSSNTIGTGAAIEGFADQAWTTGSLQGGYLSFLTALDNTTTKVERLRINAQGYAIPMTSTGGIVVPSTNTLPTGAGSLLGATSYGYFNTAASTPGSSLGVGTSIQGFSDQAWTFGSAQGGYLSFLTTPDGSATDTERMRITAAGQVNAANCIGIGSVTSTLTWCSGSGAPSSTPAAGSLYSRTDTGQLYVYQGGTWTAK